MDDSTLLPPDITITDATPQKHLGTPTSASNRLLYRGALSLPDSYLQLEGLTFSARLSSHGASSLYDSPSHSFPRADVFARDLMHNPLALALESMRGRQSLRFKGTVRLQDVWIDETGHVYVDIHPFATLTRIYFENILCLSPLTPSDDASGPKRTEVGIRVSLGDTDGPETTDIIIYGETGAHLHPPQLSPATSSTSHGPPPLAIRVARITPAPRAPRPDDPTPRKPPTHLFAKSISKSTLGELGANKRIVPPPNGVPKPQNAKSSHKAQPPGQHKDRKISGNDVFKVPELPDKVRRKQGGAGTDVFGTIEPPPGSENGGKGKAKATVTQQEEGDSLEVANKLVLKKSAVHHLSNAGIPRTHPEFKELFGFVYRGAVFALRSRLKTSHISAQISQSVVEAHVKLYVPLSDAHTPRGHMEMLSITSDDFSMDVDDAGG